MHQSLISFWKVFVISVLLSATDLAKATTQTWDNGAGDFIWGSSLNWGGAAWTAGNDAVFGATGVGTVTVSGTQTVGTGTDTPITFNYGGYTITGGTLALPSGTSTSTFLVNSNATIASLISASSANTLLKSGTGTLTLDPGTGNTDALGSLKTTAGGLALNSGTLNVTAAGGSAGAGLFVNGGTLTVAGGTLNANAGNYATINNGGILVVTNGTCNINNGAELLNGYGGLGTINLSGTGVLSLNILRVSQGSGGYINLNGGTLQLNRFNYGSGIGTVNFNGSTVQAKSSLGNFTAAGITYSVQAGGAIFDSAGFNITVTAPLIHDPTLGSIPDGGVTKNGTGTLMFTGTNTYTGPTAVNAGTLSITNPMLAASAAVNIATNAVLNLNFSGTNTVAMLLLGGVPMAAGTYNNANSPAYLTGAGNLLNLGGSPAANLIWTGAANANWDTITTNWSQGGSASAWINNPPANATFGATGAGTVNLTQSISANSLSFLAPGYTISGNTLTLGTNTPNVVANANVTISSVLTNSTGLTMSGTGALTLNGANTFGGQVVVNSGALVLNNLSAIKAGDSLVIADGAVVQPKLAGTYPSVATTINGDSVNNGSFGGALDFHSGGSTTVTWPGQINLSSSSATIGSYGITLNVTLAGQLTGSGSLRIRPEGGSPSSHTATYTLSNPSNNYAGSTTMQVGTAQLSSTLKLGTNNALPASTTLNLNGVGASGTVYFDLAGYSQALGGLMANYGSSTVVNSGAFQSTLTVSNALGMTYIGALGATGKANLNFIKQGGGTFTINGTNVYTGSTTISAGTLALNGVITATSGLLLNSNSSLALALGKFGGQTNIIVNGNAVLSGTININDFGIVSNTAYPVIYYTGSLTTNGLTVATNTPWAFTIDTSVPHLVRFVTTQQFPTVQFTSPSQIVSNSLQLDLSGIVRGFPAAPMYYEVRTPDRRLWDFGATPPTPNWIIHLRHLRQGTNSVRVFTVNNAGALQQATNQIVLQLGSYPPVRPRPYPAEVWWGGVATDLAPNYGYDQLTDQTRPWDFVKKYQDGIFLHGILPTDTTLAALASVVAAYNGRFGRESGYYTHADPNFGINNAAAINTQDLQLANDGVCLTFHSFDFMPGMAVWPNVIDPGWCENWPNWSHAQLLDSNLQCWSDFVSILHTNWPGLKLGWTWSPVYFNWGGYPCTLGNDSLILHPVQDANGNPVLNQYGTNAWFDFDMLEFFNKASATAQAGDGYWGFASDCPYSYFAQWANPGAQYTNQQKILAYENWERTNGFFPTTICNGGGGGSDTVNGG